MSPNFRLSRLGSALLCVGLPLLGGAGEGGLEFGASLKIQRPLGEFQSTVLDAGLGYGLGFRTRYKFQGQQALTARLDYDLFTEGETEVHGSNYLMTEVIKVREMAIGVNYEWLLSGGNVGGYLLVGPVYRRWQDERTSSYFQSMPGTVPPNQSVSTSPTGLGFDMGWGYRGASNSVIEIHLVTGKYGDTGYTANSLQFSFIHYW